MPDRPIRLQMEWHILQASFLHVIIQCRMGLASCATSEVVVEGLRAVLAQPECERDQDRRGRCASNIQAARHKTICERCEGPYPGTYAEMALAAFPILMPPARAIPLTTTVPSVKLDCSLWSIALWAGRLGTHDRNRLFPSMGRNLDNI